MRWLRNVLAALAMTSSLLAGAQGQAGAQDQAGAHGLPDPQGLAGAFEGTVDAGPVRVEFTVVGDAVTGTLVGPGIYFGLEGRVSHTDGYGYGQVDTGQGTAAFEAYIAGDVLGLYLFELDAAGAPVMASVIELVLARTRPAPDTIIATGHYATLTLDNAEAFIEALEFVLAQIGYAHQFTDAERHEALAAIAASFPSADQVDQVVLADARTIWQRVEANWHAASVEDQREFALGVLILAFGEETVAAWVGPTGGGQTQGDAGRSLGATSHCTTFEDCTGNFVDTQTWTDTFNAQGCWAAAGCSSFDPTTSSFDYRDY